MAGTWADIGREFRRASAIQRIVRSVASGAPERPEATGS